MNLPLIRTSERSDFKRCPTKWNWRWREQLVPLDYSTGPLWAGTGGHLAMAGYYIPGTKRGIHPAETWDAYAKDSFDVMKYEKVIDDELDEDFASIQQLIHDLLVEYVNHYGAEEHLEVLAVERPFSVNIPNPVTKKPIVRMLGTIDLVVRNHAENGRIELWDHKFMKSISTEWLEIDDQNGGYLTVGTHILRELDLIGPNEVVRGLMYNFLRKAKKDERPMNEIGQRLNKDGTVSKIQGKPLFERWWVAKTAAERNQQIRRIGEEARIMRLMERGKLPLFKTPNYTCQWSCDFFDLCKIDEAGGDTEEFKNNVYKKVDPYADHREDAINSKLIIPK